MSTRQTKRQRKGFTLLEVLAVAAIIALLAVFVVPRAFKGLGKAKADIARGKLGILESGISRFQYDCGRLLILSVRMSHFDRRI